MESKKDNNLKHYRIEAGLSQAQLAEKVGISHRTLQDYEQDRKPLEKAAAITVLNMARTLGCTVEALIGEHKPILSSAVYKRVQSRLKEEKVENVYIPPLGYKQQGDKIVVVEEEAEVVKRAFDEMVRDGSVSPDTEKELRRLWKQHYKK